MNIAVYDPPDKRHQYVTEMYFDPLLKWLHGCGIMAPYLMDLTSAAGYTVLINADHLTPDVIAGLRDNGNRIVGFSCTDSSYVSQACREGKNLRHVDLMFMLTGIQNTNIGHEVVMTPDFKLGLEWRQFLPPDDWSVFNSMRVQGRLQSLPYVHWHKQPSIVPQEYGQRSQKALIRGGHHMRRFLLCLELMKHDKLDVNSGFYTAPYFRDDMNPQFRYCDDCRRQFSKHGYYPISANPPGCLNPHCLDLDVSNLGEWNNKCPHSFFRLAKQLGADMKQVEKLMNAQWLRAEDHLAMLSRITFTSDLKWLFSIYAAQRFWDAAMSGCINVLPSRTMDQDYFPVMEEGIHYLTYQENFIGLDADFWVDEIEYMGVAANAYVLYNKWIKATDYALNTNLLAHIWERIEEHCS